MKRVLVSIPPKILDIIDEIVNEGEYVSRTQYINEAILWHLRTWYAKRLEKGESPK
jgi:Arc/MetJ-type ribon-helix-helix transcriptional regulator